MRNAFRLIPLILGALLLWATTTHAAITASLLTEDVDTTTRTAGNAYTTASVAPSADALIVACFMGEGSTGSSATPTIGGTLAVSWTPLQTQAWNTTATQLSVLACWYATTGGSPGSGTITAVYAVDRTGVMWKVFEFTGTNTAAPVPQSAKNAADAVGNGGDLTVTLGAFGSTSNGTLLVFNWDNTSSGFTLNGGLTELGTSLTLTAPNRKMADGWVAANDGAPTVTFTTNSDVAGIALEVAEAVEGGGGPAPRLLLLGIGGGR